MTDVQIEFEKDWDRAHGTAQNGQSVKDALPWALRDLRYCAGRKEADRIAIQPSQARALLAEREALLAALRACRRAMTIDSAEASAARDLADAALVGDSP